MTFDDIIGQNQAKQELSMRLNAFKEGEAMPSLLFVAPRGKGKTALATATGKQMKEISGGVKKFYELNCASIKGIKSFWNSIIVPLVNDKDVTILLDECHNLPNDVTNCLLTLINPNVHNRTTYSFDDMVLDFDQTRGNFLFATTEPHLLFHALVNRCRRIDLEDYTDEQMAIILEKASQDVTFEDGVLATISSTLRGTPRQAIQMSKDVKTYLKTQHRDCFTGSDWSNLSNILGILPLGLSRLELRVLRTLETNRDARLTRIAACLQMTPQSVQKDLELFLLNRGLIRIDESKRNLTNLGWDYLKSL